MTRTYIKGRFSRYGLRGFKRNNQSHSRCKCESCVYYPKSKALIRTGLLKSIKDGYMVIQNRIIIKE